MSQFVIVIRFNIPLESTHNVTSKTESSLIINYTATDNEKDNELNKTHTLPQKKHKICPT